jgi:hypothetical protein
MRRDAGRAHCPVLRVRALEPRTSTMETPPKGVFSCVRGADLENSIASASI